MRAKKTSDQLKRSGTWNSLSKAKRAERLAEEDRALRPPIPPGLDDATRADFESLCDQLAAESVLDPSDAPLLLEFIEASRAEDTERAQEITAHIFARKQDDVAPALEALVFPDAAAIAKGYAADVVSRVIVAGKFVRLACQRFLDDLENAGARGLRFDADAAQHVVDYITDLGRTVEPSKRLTLVPWQTFCLANIFGWIRVEDGLRRFRNAYVQIAKKNGKTALAAALALFLSDPAGDGEDNAQVYCAATTKFQSRSLCFKEALRLRSQSPELSDRSRAWRSILEWSNGSSFEPLASNSDKLQGLNPHGVILDELGDHATPDLAITLTSGRILRRQPLAISITTAGLVREGQVAWDFRNRAVMALENTSPDDGNFAFVAELDENDDWLNESVWPKANPSLGTLMSIRNLGTK